VKREGTTRQKAAGETLRISNGGLRIFVETAKRSSEDVGDDVAEGVVALALADAVAFAQALDANGEVSHK
jgi:hypothetical protein